MITLTNVPAPGAAPIVVKIVEDSITEDGDRLITQIWEYPRSVHSEILTHRDFSRNAASSRAIPAKKLRERTLEACAETVHWGANQAGMQASGEVADEATARAWWRKGRDLMAALHAEGEALGLHKQVVNRVIEPWMTIAVVVSMTNHANFFHLRDHEMAEPNVQALAQLAWQAFNKSTPTIVPNGGWHLPFVDENREMYHPHYLRKLSAARCARISYMTHEGTRDVGKDVELHDKLVGQKESDPMHASPLEHPAIAVGNHERHGNFVGWKQYRKFFDRENGPAITRTQTCCGLWIPNKYDKQHTDNCRVLKGIK